NWEAVFESRAGYLDVEDCVLAHLGEAQKLGAELRTGIEVRGWHKNGDGVTVETDSDTFHAAKLVIAAGPWANTFLKELGIPLTVLRSAVFWYPITAESLRADRGCPAYLFDTPECPYGIPQVDDFGFKIAEHAAPREARIVADPLNVDRALR